MRTLIKNWMNSKYLPFIIIAIYILLSVIKIEHPGINNDQFMFVNAAAFNPDNMFLWKSYHGFPIMVFPYIGALKSYLYMPIFYFFGVNMWSIRLPQIILIAISLYLLYKSLSTTFNKKIALITVLFLSLDPSNVIYSKVDNGPTVIEFFLKVLTIYLFSVYYKTKNIIFFLSIYPVLILGIFNKINFFWFVNSFFISFIIFYGKSFYNNFKNFGKLVPFILIAVPYYIILRFFIKLSRETALSYKNFTNEVSISNITNNFPIFYKNLSDIINGNLFFNKIYGYDPTNLGGYFTILILLILFVGLIVITHSKDKVFFRNYLFITLITMLISLQILLTKRAVSGWHVVAVYPFFAIIFATGIYKIYEIVRHKSIKIFLASLVGFIILYQISVNFIFINKYSTPTQSIAWSSSIYDLIDYVRVTNTKFVCLDIDICNQLISLTQQSGKYKEPFAFLESQTYTDSFRRLVGNFNSPSQFLYVSHADTNSYFPIFKKSFFNYLKDNGVTYVKVKEFKDGDSIIFELYKVGYFSK